MGLRQRSRRRAGGKTVEGGRSVRGDPGGNNESAVGQRNAYVAEGSERPTWRADEMTDGAVLSGRAGRRADGMLRFVVRLRQIRRANVVTCFVAESPEGHQQQQGNDPRRAPQPGQKHTEIQISILTGCFP